eukprot:m.11762 g.11762  ORF g.11762 m.11762 type:complete len:522 (+) comp23589_c0_seq2:888-2453(+)
MLRLLRKKPACAVKSLSTRFQNRDRKPIVISSLFPHGLQEEDNIKWTPLHYASRHGMCDEMKVLLAQCQRKDRLRSFVNAKDRFGDTPMSDAAYWGAVDIVRELLVCQADPNSVNEKGHSVVCRALQKGDLEMLKVLVEEPRTDLNTVLDEHGNTLSHFVAYYANRIPIELITYLIEKGLDFSVENDHGDTAIMRASRIRANAPPIVEMIKSCQDTEQPGDSSPLIFRKSNYWYSYQFWKSPEKVNSMIDEGVIDYKQKDQIGWTYFHYMAKHNMVNQLRKLYDLVGDESEAHELINAQDNYGDTPLSDAAHWGHFKMVQLLIKLGADPNQTNLAGQTPALRAINSCCLVEPSMKVAKYLISRSDLTKELDCHGNTPLHEICYLEHPHIPEIVKYILERRGHDLALKENKYGDSPRSRASRILNLKVLDVIEREMPDSLPSDLDVGERQLQGQRMGSMSHEHYQIPAADSELSFSASGNEGTTIQGYCNNITVYLNGSSFTLNVQGSKNLVAIHTSKDSEV